MRSASLFANSRRLACEIAILIYFNSNITFADREIFNHDTPKPLIMLYKLHVSVDIWINIY